MSALEFLINGGRQVSVAHYDHGTHHGHEARKFLEQFCKNQKIDFIYEVCDETPPTGRSKEEFWRTKRYNFFRALDGPIVMGHHLDDAVEWWVFSALRGNPTLIPIRRSNPDVLRPFLLTPKSKMHDLLNKHPHIEDPSNSSIDFARNYIRHNLLHRCQKVNPGIQKTVRNLYLKKEKHA